MAGDDRIPDRIGLAFLQRMHGVSGRFVDGQPARTARQLIASRGRLRALLPGQAEGRDLEHPSTRERQALVAVAEGPAFQRDGAAGQQPAGLRAGDTQRAHQEAIEPGAGIGAPEGDPVHRTIVPVRPCSTAQ